MTLKFASCFKALAAAALVAGLAAPGAASAAQPGFGQAAPMASDADCLSLAIYYEARSESAQGQHAVAQVVLNRVRDPNYPDDVCSVVFQGFERRTGCQFSFTCDGSMARLPQGQAWTRARQIAAAALAGRTDPVIGGATHYHTTAIRPYWAPSLTRIATVGAHIFYTNGRSGGQSAPVQRATVQTASIQTATLQTARLETATIPFERVERVVLSARDDMGSGSRGSTVRVHRGNTNRSR